METDDINQLESNIKKFKEEKNLIECLTSLEKIIKLKTEKFGKHSEEVFISTHFTFLILLLVYQISKRSMRSM